MLQTQRVYVVLLAYPIYSNHPARSGGSKKDIHDHLSVIHCLASNEGEVTFKDFFEGQCEARRMFNDPCLEG